jgi:hypothetical protein
MAGGEASTEEEEEENDDDDNDDDEATDDVGINPGSVGFEVSIFQFRQVSDRS